MVRSDELDTTLPYLVLLVLARRARLASTDGLRDATAGVRRHRRLSRRLIARRLAIHLTPAPALSSSLPLSAARRAAASSAAAAAEAADDMRSSACASMSASIASGERFPPAAASTSPSTASGGRPAAASSRPMTSPFFKSLSRWCSGSTSARREVLPGLKRADTFTLKSDAALSLAADASHLCRAGHRMSKKTLHAPCVGQDVRDCHMSKRNGAKGNASLQPAALALRGGARRVIRRV